MPARKHQYWGDLKQLTSIYERGRAESDKKGRDWQGTSRLTQGASWQSKYSSNLHKLKFRQLTQWHTPNILFCQSLGLSLNSYGRWRMILVRYIHSLCESCRIVVLNWWFTFHNLSHYVLKRTADDSAQKFGRGSNEELYRTHANRTLWVHVDQAIRVGGISFLWDADEGDRERCRRSE